MCVSCFSLCAKWKEVPQPAGNGEKWCSRHRCEMAQQHQQQEEEEEGIGVFIC